MMYRDPRLVFLSWLLLTLGLFAVPASLRAAPPVELVFVYGSEKQKWLEEVTRTFQDTNPVVEGRPVQVILKPMGSGETVEEVISGRLKAHLISPASEACGNRSRRPGLP